MGTRSQAAASSSKFRQRKLNPRTALPILREDQIDGLDDDAQRHHQPLDSGVEKAEETVCVAARCCSVVARHSSSLDDGRVCGFLT